KADLAEVIAAFIDYRGPAVLEVIIDPDAGVYPMVGPGMSYREMITGDFIPSRYDEESGSEVNPSEAF
ncbi:MAG: acetolactate synthase, large subunit, biosynthetic type, partial [Salinisphaera sp.]|nr:acetolactate synthase, large subunit, biosynthetic type [Salinisphaera sp.]